MLGGVESMMPPHNAIASAWLQSSISIDYDDAQINQNEDIDL